MGKAFKLEEDESSSEELPHTRTFTFSQPLTQDLLYETLYRVDPVKIHDRFTDGVKQYVVVQVVSIPDYTRISLVDILRRQTIEFNIPILYSSTPALLPPGCKISIKYI